MGWQDRAQDVTTSNPPASGGWQDRAQQIGSPNNDNPDIAPQIEGVLKTYANQLAALPNTARVGVLGGLTALKEKVSPNQLTTQPGDEDYLTALKAAWNNQPTPSGDDYLRRLGVPEDSGGTNPIYFKGGVIPGTKPRAVAGDILDLASYYGIPEVAGTALENAGANIYSKAFGKADAMNTAVGKMPPSKILLDEGKIPLTETQSLDALHDIADNLRSQEGDTASTVKAQGVFGDIDTALERPQAVIDRIRASGNREKQASADIMQADLDSLRNRYTANPGDLASPAVQPIAYDELGSIKSGVQNELSPEDFRRLVSGGDYNAYQKAKGLGLREMQMNMAEAATPGAAESSYANTAKLSAIKNVDDMLQAKELAEANRAGKASQVTGMLALEHPGVAATNELVRLSKAPGAKTLPGFILNRAGQNLQRAAMPSTWAGLLTKDANK